MQETRYFEHLKHHMKLKETQEGSILKRNELLQSNKRQNYQLEMGRLMTSYIDLTYHMRQQSTWRKEFKN